MERDGTQSVERYSYSERVVREVAAVEGVPPEEVTPPLHEAVDPEALDGLFSDDSESGLVSFSYCGYGVTVHADGRVDVRDEQ